jgi:hypothetical protein
MFWGAAKKIMYPKTIEKVKFLDSGDFPKNLQEYIAIENIPEVFGGFDTEYADLFRQ